MRTTEPLFIELRDAARELLNLRLITRLDFGFNIDEGAFLVADGTRYTEHDEPSRLRAAIDACRAALPLPLAPHVL